MKTGTAGYYGVRCLAFVEQVPLSEGTSRGERETTRLYGHPVDQLNQRDPRSSESTAAATHGQCHLQRMASILSLSAAIMMETRYECGEWKMANKFMVTMKARDVLLPRSVEERQNHVQVWRGICVGRIAHGSPHWRNRLDCSLHPITTVG